MKIADPIISIIDDANATQPFSGLHSRQRVTCVVQDNIDVQNHHTGLGHPLWAATHRLADKNSALVDMFIHSGFSLVGKTMMDELGCNFTGYNPHFGLLNNHNAFGHCVGGASSGPAAAVAAKKADLGIGIDSAGAIRIPASYCGLWGLRTTHNWLPMSGILFQSTRLDSVGFLANEIDVLQQALSIFNQHHVSVVEEKPRLILLEDACKTMERAERLQFERVQQSVCSLFSTVAETSLGEDIWDIMRISFPIVQGFEAWARYGKWILKHRPILSKPVEDFFDFSRKIQERDYLKSLQVCDQLKYYFQRRFGSETFIGLPTIPHVSPRVLMGESEWQNIRMQSLQHLAFSCISGRPELSLPVMVVGPSRLPLGMSFLAYPDRDVLLCDIGKKVDVLNKLTLVEQVS